KVLLQAAMRRHEELPEVPAVIDLAKTDEHKQILRLMLASAEARPIAAPPDIPADRAAALRGAFAKLVADPEYLAEMKRLKLDPSGPMTGGEPRQVCRRLQILRDWSHGESQDVPEVLGRGA
ncbi:MAG: hypothetical protein ACRDNP_14405, partial [Gaiellaceae bacterium]